MIPAIVYWTTIKQAFVEYQAFEYDKGGTVAENKAPTKHENRVRDVTNILISLSPLATIARFGYTFVTGKSLEPVLEKMDAISEKLLEASDAAMYLVANAGLGVMEVVENGIEYGGAAAEYLAGHKEQAKEILRLDITGDMKAKLDELYGRENWVKAISNSVKRFGASATYIGLGTLLSAGGVTAVAAGMALVFGKAGETTKSDISKTGELSSKEMIHGLIAGASMLAFAELGKASVDALESNASNIAKELCKIIGENIDPKLLKSITASVISGFEASALFASYDIPEQLSKEMERVFDIDPDAKGDWIEVLGGTGAAFLTAATFMMIKELYVNHGFYSTYEDRLKQTPQNTGEWTGKRGESKFISDDESVNSILRSEGLDGIEYSDAIPDFSEISKGTVKIDNMTGKRHGRGGNFEQAFEKLSEVKGYSVDQIASWMDKNNYVWHECNDMKTMQKIPFEVNLKFGHLGGVGECIRKEKLFDEIVAKSGIEGGVFDV